MGLFLGEISVYIQDAYCQRLVASFILGINKYILRHLNRDTLPLMNVYERQQVMTGCILFDTNIKCAPYDGLKLQYAWDMYSFFIGIQQKQITWAEFWQV